MDRAARIQIVLLFGCLAAHAMAGHCRCVPADGCWPSPAAWDALNVSVAGQLVKNIPVAAPCYVGQELPYNPATCASITRDWGNASLHLKSPVGYQFPTETPCPARTDAASGQCSLGNAPVYTINATEHGHVALGIRFAREQNLRLVVRNTGHDLLGRSSGFGSLQIWIRYLRTGIDYIESFAPSTGGGPCPGEGASVAWNGPSITVGGGYDWGEAYEIAAAHGKIIVGGTTPSVGCIGGWLQGGGHSLVSPNFGLGADQLLEAKVVLADGSVAITNRCTNPRLFRAIRGGGPSYGVVVSATWKVYPTRPVASHALTLVSEARNDTMAFLAAVTAVYRASPSLLDGGLSGYGVWSIDEQVAGALSGSPAYTHTLLGLDKSVADVEALLAPLLAQLQSLNGVRVSYSFHQHPTFAAFQASSALTNGTQSAGLMVAFGSRLLDKRALTANMGVLARTIKTIGGDAGQGTVNGLLFVGGGQVSVHRPDTAVLPAWRSTYVHALTQRMWPQGASREHVEALQNDITNTKVAALKRLAPHTGAYMNEADRFDPDWPSDFYGWAHYRELQAVKNLYDPDGLFYCPTCVGALEWKVNERGALCRL